MAETETAASAAPSAPAPSADLSSAAATPPAATARAQEASPFSAPEYSFRNADGSAAEESHAKELTELATELKLSPEHASKLYARDLARRDAHSNSLIKQWETAAADAEKMSRERFGDKYDAMRANAKLMADKFSHKDFPSIWESITRLGADRDPAILEFLNTIFQGQREPSTVVPGNAPAARPKSHGEVFYPEMYGKS